MKFLFTLLMAATLAACATKPISTSQARDVPKSRILNPTLLTQKSGYGRVIVKRDTGLSVSACNTRIYANGEAIAEISTGEKVTFFLPPGQQMIAAESTGICAGGLIEREITVSAARTSIFRVSYGSVGEFLLQPTAF